MRTYAANNDADSSGLFGIIDFTDDPAGFAGEIPGHNRWPSAENANVDGKGDPLNQEFFAHITGDFYTSAADTFTFQTYNDDGVFLYIDGELIIDDPTFHQEIRFTGSKLLNAGNHSVELFFFERGGEASLEFTVASSDGIFRHFNDPQGSISLDPSTGTGTGTGTGTVSVSEPSSIALLSLCLFGLARSRRKK